MQEQIISIAFTVAGALLSALIPYLVAMAIGAIRDERARRYAGTVVMAAQQAIPTNSARYEWAAAELARRFPLLRQKEVQALIEAAVLALKHAPIVPQPQPDLPAVEVQAGDEDESDRA